MLPREASSCGRAPRIATSEIGGGVLTGTVAASTSRGDHSIVAAWLGDLVAVTVFDC